MLEEVIRELLEDGEQLRVGARGKVLRFGGGHKHQRGILLALQLAADKGMEGGGGELGQVSGLRQQGDQSLWVN